MSSQIPERTNIHGPAEIKPRDVHFDKLKDLNMHNWHGGNPIISQLYNGLSLLFPEGEDFFVHSVRIHAKQITDPALKTHVKGFMTQEAIHSREHIVYNEALDEQKIPTKRVLEMNHKGIEWTKKGSKQSQLASTAAAEHFTATLADMLLTDDRMMGDAPEEMKRIWRWHAVEETEHKAVAYDVYQACYPGVQGYLVRCLIMLLTLVTFVPGILLGTFALLRGVNEKPTGKHWRQALKFLFWGPGFITKMVWRSLPYFKPSFHPWDEQNFHHITEWNEA
ncbi:MAG: metal-dependent hydrolase [Alphaproteobacteria bacterium]